MRRCAFCGGECKIPSSETYQLVRQWVRTDTKDGATLREYDEWYACKKCVTAKAAGTDPNAPTLFDAAEPSTPQEVIPEREYQQYWETLEGRADLG